MKRRGDKDKSAAELRRRAEEQVAARRAGTEPAERDLRYLVHELEVHQLELEMQNEELLSRREEAEAVLRRYADLFDFAPIGYVAVSPEGVISTLNLRAASMLGAARKVLVGTNLFSYVGEEQRPVVRSLLAGVCARAGEGEVSETREIVLRSPAGAIDVQLLGTAVAEQAPAGAVLVAIQDISARKRAEAALHEESRRKDEFLAALSHELRNPLSAIVSSLYVLQQDSPAEATARKAAAIIDRQVGQLVHIVDDLLDVTRIARGKVRLERELCELGEIVRRAMEDHRPGFEAAAIVFEGHFDAERLWVDADSTRIVQVVGNLFGNALKFTPRGGRVDVTMRREGDDAVVSVRDTGMGIIKEVREHLFEPFMQGPQSLDRRRGGLGLGLTTVKGLVELHGGAVQVASEGSGRGAEITFRLPLAPPPALVAASAARPHVARHRVLIIEDNPDTAESLGTLLTLRGHDVMIAWDGPTGLASAKDVLPDVIICDIGLPGMDGYAVAHAIRADHALARMYLVALSGYAQPDDSQRSADAGFDCHIAKPPNVHQLDQVIGGAPLLSPSGRR